MTQNVVCFLSVCDSCRILLVSVDISMFHSSFFSSFRLNLLYTTQSSLQRKARLLLFCFSPSHNVSCVDRFSVGWFLASLFRLLSLMTGKGCIACFYARCFLLWCKCFLFGVSCLALQNRARYKCCDGGGCLWASSIAFGTLYFLAWCSLVSFSDIVLRH